MYGRRKFLKVLGGGVVVAAIGAGGWAATRDPAGARAPWREAGLAQEGDPRRKALSWAVLAPNPHNRQPWLADLTIDGELALYCDPDRRLPHTDPFDRQIVIGLGCFLELLSQAAAEEGWRVDIELFPEGEPQPRLDARPVARARFVADPAVRPDPLFAQVSDRRSNKEPFDTRRPVYGAELQAIASAARTSRIAHSADPVLVGELRELAWEALYLEMTTRETAKESVDLLRIGRAEIEANPDGIDLSGPLIEALDAAGMLSREAMLDPESSTFRQQLPIMKAPIDTGMAFMWQTTADNSRADQIRAGRDYVRLNLAASALGVGMQPLSQALQEYPEMRAHFDRLRTTLEIPVDETLQMFVRLGYGADVAASPRWRYQTRVIGA